MEVVPVHVADVVVPVGIKVRLSPSCVEAPTAMGTEEEELFPPTMNGGRKTLNQGTLWSGTEALPTLCLRVPPQHEESPEQGDTRSNLIEKTKDNEGEHHPNGVRS